ncbi:MAG TPA: hypothetical protein VJZ06_04925 [Mobilitalea sp.]|nr:hypothetical protein [Mobilitalea sp.]
MSEELQKPIKIKCRTIAEQMLIKRNIKATECNRFCEYKSQCTKTDDMTCGEFILSLVEWDIDADNN